ncbi:MAG: phosphopantetheine-binding protein [Cyclobacteriaceae bacterium]|nr:phosphopantetheine-binding protein [Cyclobacteriaceae bacterium]
MDKEELKTELKNHIIKYLNLLDLTPEDIKDDEVLFGENLGLDSIDSIELIVMLEREYKIKIKDPKEGRKVLIDVNHIADYIISENEKSA